MFTPEAYSALFKFGTFFQKTVTTQESKLKVTVIVKQSK